MKAAQKVNPQVEVLIPSAVPHGFDYRTPDGMALTAGDIVTVPFGRSQSLGVVWGEGQAQIAHSKIRPVALHHEQFPALSPAMRQFIDWAAWYNCAPKGAVLKMVVPVEDIGKEGRKSTSDHIEKFINYNNINLADLSEEQKKAAGELESKLDKGFSVSLLDGVTGSGKTEVYFDTIIQSLKQSDDNQVLVLLPEIALSIQWLSRFEQRFGFTPVVWNSEITPARKRAGWQAIARGEARVVIGARSALFLPYKKLSLIVVDEEHDSSYKQEEGIIYHARDMAVARGRFEKLPVVLVSATPSLETHYNARQGRYSEISLPLRHAGAEMPHISMIDMRGADVESDSFISRELRDALAKTIGDGHQAMLFLNRRGYAPLMLCRACGHRFQCPECSTWLVLHRGKPRLECHHCGYRLEVPETCPECKAEGKLHACGPGVERLLEEVKSFLPEVRVAVMASDSMSNFGELSDTINAMSEKRIDLLIGTQMIAKGHHFADLALVGVVDADLGLAGGDLRAAERTYQLLHQISGRAGREQVRGQVYLQSYLPEHPVMKALVAGDRDAFFAAELQARENAGMPPFSRLAAVIIEGASEEHVLLAAKQLASSVSHDKRLHVLGPAPAPFYMLRGRYRYRFMVRAERAINLPDYMRAWVSAQDAPSSVRIKVDIDPQSFL